MHYNDITFDRYQSEMNHSSTGYLDWERNQGISNTSNKGNVNCHENFVQEFTPVQEANTSFIHSKTKQSTNSSIHNSRPTKKVHEVDSLSERFIFSSPLYPTYHPTIIPHSMVFVILFSIKESPLLSIKPCTRILSRYFISQKQHIHFFPKG